MIVLATLFVIIFFLVILAPCNGDGGNDSLTVNALSTAEFRARDQTTVTAHEIEKFSHNNKKPHEILEASYGREEEMALLGNGEMRAFVTPCKQRRKSTAFVGTQYRQEI